MGIRAWVTLKRSTIVDEQRTFFLVVEITNNEQSKAPQLQTMGQILGHLVTPCQCVTIGTQHSVQYTQGSA